MMKLHPIRGNERGIVSIIVTVILILLMSLIVLAMSQNSNREQRQALDRQLSDQAFYNAESGVNDWATYLAKNPNAPDQKSDCETNKGNLSGTGNYPRISSDLPDPELDQSGNSYTCVLYDKLVSEAAFDDVGFNNTKIIPVKLVSSTSTTRVALKKIEFTITPSDTETATVDGCNLTAAGVLPQSLPANCDIGVLRAELFRSNGGLDRNGLIQNNYVVFGVPGSNAASNIINYTNTYPENQGIITTSRCQNGQCQFSIDNINAPAGADYYLVVKSIYKNSKVIVKGYTNLNEEGRFKDAQIELDVTGKASDVLRRIVVRLPIGGSQEYALNNYGSNALQTSQSICKLITVGGSPGGEVVSPGVCPTN